MKKEEKTRRQEIIRSKQLENSDAEEGGAEVAYIKMRLDDHLGGIGLPLEKLMKRGASGQKMAI